MEIFLKNIGKIKDAKVEIKGISVIAGNNNTGKSTIGKSLFSVFNSIYNLKEQVSLERRNSIRRLLNINFDYHRENNPMPISILRLSKEICDKKDFYSKNKGDLINIIKQYGLEVDEESQHMEIDHLIEILSIPDRVLIKRII